MPEPRLLTFATLDRVMPEVDSLLGGYKAVGNWSLGQICNHLTFGLRGSLDGFPDQAPWLIRKTIAPFVFRKILRDGRMTPGTKVPEKYVPRPGLDDRAEAEALRAALVLFSASPGPFAVHPFFGTLSPELWTRIHCMHCAHHLGFLHPAAPS